MHPDQSPDVRESGTGLPAAGARPPFAGARRCGMVFGGGGARGLAGVGVMEVLHEAGCRPAAVAGTSMGALLGAFLAAGHTPERIHSFVSKLRWTDVLDISTRGGIIRGERFGRWLEANLPSRFEDLAFPLTVTATDIDTGELILLREGELIPAIRATCAFPGAFAPVQHAGRNLVDGGLLVTVPVAALDPDPEDFDLVVACDFNPPRDRRVVRPESREPRRAWESFWRSLTFSRRALAADILLKAVDIMQSEMCARQLDGHRPDMTIRPALPAINIEDFRRSEEIIAAGAAAAREALAAWDATAEADRR